MHKQVYVGDDIELRSSFLAEMNALTEHHVQNCEEYRRICTSFFPRAAVASSLDQVPYVPVGLFKSMNLSSISTDEVYQVLRSSGTTGTASRITLDRVTAAAQTQWLTQTMKFWLGEKRRRMLVVDTASVLTGPSARSARAAAILGMLRFGKDVHWLLDDAEKVDIQGLETWLGEKPNEPVFIFGFTFMVWRHFIQGLSGRYFDLSSSTLFHGGGWKTLLAEAVSAKEFREELTKQFGIEDIHDYYGMVEQLGGIWVEVESGTLVPTSRSTVLIRDPHTFEVVDSGSKGLIQVFSSLPKSYPGHSILTEDLGRIVENNVQPEVFGSSGLQILGRLPKSQPRGCSDAVQTMREHSDD